MRMRRLELILQQPYGVVCKRLSILFVLLFVQGLVWSTRGLCLGRSLGAPWPCPAPGSSCSQDVLGWMHGVRAAIPTLGCPLGASFGCFQGGGDNFLSPVVLCQALPQGRLDLSSAWVASPTGKLS